MEKTQQNISLVCVGDSYTDYSPSTYVTTLQANLKGVRVINKGIGGDTAVGLEKRFNDDVLALKPDMCYIQIGGNDVLGGEQNVDSIVNRIIGMVSKCMEADIIPVLGLYKLPLGFYRGRLGWSEEIAQNRFKNMNALHDKLATLAKKYKIDYVSIDVALFKTENGYAAQDFNRLDDIHPSAIGAAKIGNYVSAELAKFITKHVPDLGAKAAPYGGENRVTEPQTKTIICIGDCFSTETDNCSWVNMAQYEMPEVAFKNISTDGMDTAAIVGGFDMVRAYTPDMVVSAVGLIDCAGDNVDTQKVFDNINAFSVKCWDIGAKPVLCFAQPSQKHMAAILGEKKGKQVYEYAKALADYYKKVVPQFDNVGFIEDIFAPIKVDGEVQAKYLTSDKMHLSVLGAEKVGAYIAGKLKEM